MWLFQSGSPRQIWAGLALLRVLGGVVFFAHGAQKLLTIGLAGVVQGFTQMGVPLPGLTAPMITFLELGGGLMLVVGLLTRAWALLLACDMVSAILLVHLSAGFFLPQGYEFALTMLVAMVTLVLTGAGAYSLDAMIARAATPKPAEALPAVRPTTLPAPATPPPLPAETPQPRWASKRPAPSRSRGRTQPE
jgi:putative oxidoreductase